MKETMKYYEKSWKNVLAYPSMSSGNVKGMIGTIKLSISETVTSDGLICDEVLPKEGCPLKRWTV